MKLQKKSGLLLFNILNMIFISAAIVSADASDEQLTAKITFPYKNALIRGDVPVFGTAYGRDFKGFRLEYGEGSNPDKWILVNKSNTTVKEEITNFKFVPQIGPIQGNLGTWETGLNSYFYKDYGKDLSGIYTIRLTVENTAGKSVEDRVTVEIGEAVTNVFGGIIKSLDGNVMINVPEHALYETAVVMSVAPIDENKIKLIVDAPCKLTGEIYEIKPANWQFARDITLKFKHEGTKEKLGIYKYNLIKCEWIPLETKFEADWLTTQISRLAEGRSYYAVLYNSNMEPSANNQNMQDEKEEWSNYSGVSIKNDYIDGKKCIKLTNTDCPGYFASVVKNTKFNASEYPIIGFGYKIPPDLKINILVKVNGRWYDVIFTDNPKSYLRINMKKIGNIEAVKKDNQWHTAKFNLYKMLSNQVRTYEVEKIIMADFDSSGYMELTPGYNKTGTSYYIANFCVRKQHPDELENSTAPSPAQDSSWQLGIDDGSPDEFSYEKYEGQDKNSDTPDDFYVGEPYGKLERAIAFDSPETNIYFDLNIDDVNKTYLLSLDACNCDLRNAGYVEFQVLLNDKSLGDFTCIYEKGDIWGIAIKKGLKNGRNKLTLKWLGGGNWIAWDCIKFKQM